MAAHSIVLILAIDTTTRGGSVAITRDDTLLALVRGDESRTHGERVPGEIARALDETGLAKSALDLVAVASGPGAFTGLRIGLAAAQGLAMTLDRPVVGVSALDALAWAADDTDDADQKGFDFIVPWMDAQRGDVFAALYATAREPRLRVEPWKPWTVIETAVTASPEALLDLWRPRLAGASALFIGDAAPRDGEAVSRAGGGRWHTRAPGPLAPAVARVGWRLAIDGQAGRPHTLRPIYVRRPDAEIERERRGTP
jgi:tRNA threonylcarbamoyladenosine biosynthesis protein TsaB